jgi:hypothetical protein
MATTADTLTTAQIDALCSEAATAGDLAMVRDCQLARGAVDSSATAAERRRAIADARKRVLAAIRDAEAQS